ncbi:MAG: peroxiredoxin family protein [Owenweeksia sp.]
MKRYFPVFCIALFIVSCKPQNTKTEPVSGIWRGTIALNDTINLPFNFEWTSRDSAYSMTIMNGEERINTDRIENKGDSLIIHLPVFANYFIVKKGAERMDGYYINPDAENYRLPFNAMANDSSRFKTSAKNCCEINEKWAVKFSPGTKDESPAIGYFQQEGTTVSGTFMTETGDYRYLEGILSGDQLQLSAFDGAHLFYFKATIDGSQKMEGRFFSGRSWSEPWIGYRDDEFTLRNADSLTYLKEGYPTVEFSFPDTKGNTHSLNDERYKGKPVIVQIMGSWCPNCMDESRHLREVYKQYNKDGLEIVALTFERAKDKETAVERAVKMKEDLELPYPVLMAGYTRADKAGEALPMLNHVMSFPTSIYLDKDHKVVSVHTGYSGPGTPVYDKYVADNKLLVERIVYQNQGGQKAENL